jgi:hypothetical protein
MKDPQREVEELRAGVNCATLLEKATPSWLLDRKESSKRCLKYRRGAGEIVSMAPRFSSIVAPQNSPVWRVGDQPWA